MVVGITGGSGFVGRHITQLLVSEGKEVIIFSRNTHASVKGASVAHWDPDLSTCDTKALERVNAMIHLAGAGVADKRWTAARKKEIVDSRVLSTRFLVDQLKMHGARCQSLISASAIGLYGADTPDSKVFTEDAPPDNGFLGETCRLWEQEAQRASTFLRLAIVRIGIVLGKEAGAFPQFLLPVKLGVVPIFGDGKQIISWIHISDLASIFNYLLANQELAGAFNAVAPNPVAQKDLMKEISRELGGVRIPFPFPAFMLRVILGEMSVEILKSTRVSSQKLIRSGFAFTYSSLPAAVTDLVKQHEN